MRHHNNTRKFGRDKTQKRALLNSLALNLIAREKIKNNTIKTIDASGRTLGRVASEVAMSLMGKTKATFERNRYSGVSVKVINASNLAITAKKLDEIFHTRYSGMRGGLRTLKGAETA